MTPIDRIPYTAALPARFFSVTADSDEDPAFISQLFEMEATRNELILYIGNPHIRLVGIFPNQSDEAFFGFWETTNDLALNQLAFSLLEADARQRNRRLIIGPLNFNTFHSYRLRLNVPSWNRFDREPVNPTYYPELMNQLGFGVRSLFDSRMIRKKDIPIAYVAKQELLAGLRHIPFDFIPLNPDTWQQYEDELTELVHQVFSANPAYKPISKEQFQLLYNRQFAQKLCPYSSVLFRDKASGRLVAMSFCLPNYQSLTFPPGDTPNFARDFPQLTKKVLLVKSVGVHPAFRKQGLMSYIGAYGMLRFQELYDEVIFCLMRADNFSRHFSDNLPYEAAQYALFERNLVAE